MEMDRKGPDEQGAIEKNAIQSFEATGIFPFNPHRVMKRLPGFSDEEEPAEEVHSSLVTFLKSRRYGDKSEKSTPKKKKNMNIQPGKSVSAEQMKVKRNWELQVNCKRKVKNRFSTVRKTLNTTIFLKWVTM